MASKPPAWRRRWRCRWPPSCPRSSLCAPSHCFPISIYILKLCRMMLTAVDHRQSPNLALTLRTPCPMCCRELENKCMSNAGGVTILARRSHDCKLSVLKLVLKLLKAALSLVLYMYHICKASDPTGLDSHSRIQTTDCWKSAGPGGGAGRRHRRGNGGRGGAGGRANADHYCDFSCFLLPAASDRL